MAVNYLTLRSTLLYNTPGAVVPTGYLNTAITGGNTWTNNINTNTFTASTLTGTSMNIVSSLGIGTATPANLLNVWSNLTLPTITTASIWPAQFSILGNSLAQMNLKMGAYYTALTGSYCAIQATETYSGIEHVQPLSLQPIGGAVGIGTTNPNALLAINAGTTNTVSLTLNSAGAGWGSGMQFINSTVTTGRNYGIYADSVGVWHFADTTASADRMVINSSGSVGIGVSPSYSLDVNGTIQTRSGLAVYGGNVVFGNTASSNPCVQWGNNYIGYASGAGSYLTDSGVGDLVIRTSSTNIRFTTDAGLTTKMMIGTQGVLMNGYVIIKNAAIPTGTSPYGQFSIQDTGATLQYSAGYDTTYVYVQSWSTKPLCLNPVGNSVAIGATSSQSNTLMIYNGNNISGISLGDYYTNAVKYIGITSYNNGTSLGAGSGFSGMTLGGPNDSGGTSGYLAFSTHNYGVNSGERMRIDKAGNVGIGTTSPPTTLSLCSLYTTSGIWPGPTLSFQLNAGGGASWYAGSILGYVAANAGGTGSYPGGLAFQTKSPDNVIGNPPTTKMLLDANGILYLKAGTDNNSVIRCGPNPYSSWNATLVLGASASQISSGVAQVITTNGNLHLDSSGDASRSIYLNLYSTNAGYAPTTEMYGTTNVQGTINVNGSMNLNSANSNYGSAYYNRPYMWDTNLGYVVVGQSSCRSIISNSSTSWSYGTTLNNAFYMYSGRFVCQLSGYVSWYVSSSGFQTWLLTLTHVNTGQQWAYYMQYYSNTTYAHATYPFFLNFTSGTGYDGWYNIDMRAYSGSIITDGGDVCNVSALILPTWNY